MRVPHTIPGATFRGYECSRATQELLAEVGRQLRAENADWDENDAPALRYLAVQALVDNFNSCSPLKALPREDFHRLLENLPTTVPLEVTVPLVPDGVYWKRLAACTGLSLNVAEHGGSWRRLVVERRLQQELEDALPSVLDEALRLARLAGHLVRRLRLERLLQTAPAPWPPPDAADLLSERSPLRSRRELPAMFDTELEALDEDLCALIGHLVNLEELDVMFGMHDFEKNLSEPPNEVKVTCCHAMGKTLSTLPAFRRLCVRRSQLHLEKLEGLLEPLHTCATLTELELSHCYLGDKGMQVVATFLLDHPSLRVLRAANNKFGARGASHLARSLLQKSCAPLVELDVSLNSVGDVGGHNIIMACVPRDLRQPARDPAEDELVRDLMLAEEKERQRRAEEEPSHEGITIFRGLVARAMASDIPLVVASAAPDVTATADDDLEPPDWEAEPGQERRPSALLAVVADARQHYQEEAAAEAARREEERRLQEAAALAADRWDGAPERLLTLGMAGCRLGAAGGQAAAHLLRTNLTLTSLSLSNNALGADASASVVRALCTNPRVLHLDMRMCGAAWQDQVALERAVHANNAALRKPLPLREMLKEREDEYRARLATTTEVLGRHWERAVAVPRGHRGSVVAGVALPTATDTTPTSGSLSALGSTGGLSGLTLSATNSALGLPAASAAPALPVDQTAGTLSAAAIHSARESATGSKRSGSRLSKLAASTSSSQPSNASRESKKSE